MKSFLFFCFFLSLLITNANAVSHENNGYTLGVVYQGGTLTDSNLNDLTAAGVNAIKFQIYWSDTTQPTQNGAIDINTLVSQIALAKTHGIQKFYIGVTQETVPAWFNTAYPSVSFVDNNGTNRTGNFSAFRFACATDTVNFVDCNWQEDFNNFFTRVVSYFANDSNIKWISFGNELEYSNTYWEDFSSDSNRAFQNYLKDLNGSVAYWNSRWSLKSGAYSCNADDTNFECIVPVSNFSTSTRNDKNLVDWLSFRQIVLRNYFIQLYKGGKSVCPSCNIVADLASPYEWKQDTITTLKGGVNPAFIDGNFTDDLSTSGYVSYPDVTFAKGVADKQGKNYVVKEVGVSGGYTTSYQVYSSAAMQISHGIKDLFIFSYGSGTVYEINQKLDGVKKVYYLLANLDNNLFSRKSYIGIFYPEEITMARQSSITESVNYFNYILYALTYRFGITPQIIYPQEIFSDYNRLYKYTQKSLVRNNNFSDINSLFIPVYYADQNIQNMINYDLNSWVNSGGTVISQVTNSGSDYLPYCTTLADKTFGSNGFTTLGNYNQIPDLNTTTNFVDVFARLTNREPFTNPNTWLAVWDLNADRNAVGICSQQAGKRIFVGGNFFTKNNNYSKSISSPAIDELWLSILKTTDTNSTYRTDDWNISGKFVSSNDLNYLIIYNNATVTRSDFNISIKDANNNQRNSTDIYSVSGHFFVNRSKDGNISHFSLGANDLNIFALTDFNNMAMVVREGQDSNWAKIYNTANKLVDSQVPLWVSSNDGFSVHIDSNLSFDANATVIFTLVGGRTCANTKWLNYKSHTAKYDQNYNSTMFSCSANVITIDLNGIEPASGSDIIYFDYNAPVTTWDGNSTWQNFDANIHLTCTDNNSGCSSTMYRLDTNPATAVSYGAWTVFDKNILVKTDGNYAIDYNSTDTAGNIEDKNTKYILIERTPPITTWDGNNNIMQNFKAQIHLTCTDANSGCASTHYRINNGTWQTYTTSILITAIGATTLDFNSTDNAGNTETFQTKTVLIGTSTGFILPSATCSMFNIALLLLSAFGLIAFLILGIKAGLNIVPLIATALIVTLAIIILNLFFGAICIIA